MLSFNDLIASVKQSDKMEEFLQNFFVGKNFREYEIGEEADKEQIKALKVMFESRKPLAKRIEDAFKYDPFCKEALFAYMMTSEDVFVQLRFNAYYEQISSFAGFPEYTKTNYLAIMNLYVEFLLDISNITKAIKIEKLVIQLGGSANEYDITRLSYMYYSIEDADEFYKLYLNNNFTLFDYLLLLVTLLKHDEELKAQEVLIEMYNNIEYGTYLDHVWDLDENDPKQKAFMKEVNDCYDNLAGIPTFFSWVNKTREKYGK